MIVGLTSAARINPYATLLIDELQATTGVDFVLSTERGRIGDLWERLQRRGLQQTWRAIGRRASRRSGELQPLAEAARTRGLRLDRPLAELCRSRGIEWVPVESLSSSEAAAAVRQRQTDVLINAGGGLFRRPLLTAPRIGLLNAHMARLPDLRGVDVLEWSLLLGIEPGVTVHWIDAGVDTGDVLGFHPVTPCAQDTLETLRQRVVLQSAAAIAAHLSKPITRTPPANTTNDAGDSHQYFSLHSRLRDRARVQLESWPHRDVD